MNWKQLYACSTLQERYEVLIHILVAIRVRQNKNAHVPTPTNNLPKIENVVYIAIALVFTLVTPMPLTYRKSAHWL